MLEQSGKPGFVAGLNIQQKTELAEEIRGRILSTVSRNGGHLASNLGAAELTIALHSVLDLERDKLVFDVGHQCYAHKLLTGRADSFDTLRKLGGISGFTRTEESKYDAINSGHASDGISLALGYARARDTLKENHKVAVVLGDGAFTGGMCFEALNDAGQRPTQLLIVLNDNEMSISKNVGAFSNHLTHLRQSRTYHRFKQKIKSLLSYMPGNGKWLYRVLDKLKKQLKSLLIHNDMMFEALGAEYLGPIDGHNIAELERTFKNALRYEVPVIVHVLTQKGKGYKPAEDEPYRFHGVESFNLETGKPCKNSAPTCGAVAADVLCEIGEKNDKLVCISAAMLSGTGLQRFADKYPERCYDVGIAEEHAAALAGGLALGGLKPCLALYSTFLQRAYDQISIDICLNKAPVLLLVDRAGLNGADGETHQGIYDVGLLRSIPGMIIACPSNKAQLREMVRLGVASDKPYAIRYPKQLPEGKDEHVETGKWKQVSVGEDICIIASGRMTAIAIEAAEILSSHGISAGVVDACFIKPLDFEMLAGISARYANVLTLEDSIAGCGLGEAVNSVIGNDTAVYIMGVQDEFIPAGTVEEQLDLCGLSVKHVVQKVLTVCEDKDDSESR